MLVDSTLLFERVRFSDPTIAEEFTFWEQSSREHPVADEAADKVAPPDPATLALT